MIEQHRAQLGALESTYRIRQRNGSLFLASAAIVTAVVIFWLVRYVDAPLCMPVPLFVFGWIAAEFFIKRRTELKIFENGLTYQPLFRNHTVFWDDIEEYGHVLREDYKTADLRDEKGSPIPKVQSGRGASDWVWLQTRAGEKFHLRADLENIKGIIDHISVKLYSERYHGPPVKTGRINDA
jgi:hypothetical protein